MKRKHIIAAISIGLFIICLTSSYISPSLFPIGVLISYGLPFAAGFTGLVILIVYRHWLTFLLAIVVIGSAYYYIKRPRPKIDLSNSISVLSYNAKFFRKPHVYDKFSLDMIRQIANDSSSIKCIQEYSTNPRWKVLDVTEQIEYRGYESYTYANPDIQHNQGLGIFSKFPIINKGIVHINENQTNGMIFADLALPHDTLRVYNVHLASMNLDKRHKREILQRLMNGAKTRETEIKILTEHISTCPYPYLICGDFNEVARGYNYYSVNGIDGLSNAFEKAGRGLGFSFQPLPFIRIDHQFFSEPIQCLAFYVEKAYKLSDHFPTRGIYSLEKKTD